MVPLNLRGRTILTRKQMNRRGGCLAKYGGCDLHDLLDSAYGLALGATSAKNPMSAPEDTALISIGSERILATTDLVPLVGIDPCLAGRIAALHAMNDIYASGGVPGWCL